MGDNKRILVVDDEEQVVSVLRDSLRKLGQDYEIVTAQNGYDALEVVKKTSFDLVITDLKMPGMNGLELTEAIHTLFQTPPSFGSLPMARRQ